MKTDVNISVNTIFASIFYEKQSLYKNYDQKQGLFIKPGIQERETECGNAGNVGNLDQDSGESLKGFRGMLLFYCSGECSKRFRGMFKRIPANAQEDSGKCSRGFREMFKRILGNIRKESGKCSADSGECLTRFWGMFKRIPGNLNLDLFCEILLIFYQILQLNCEKTKEYFLRY